MLKLILDRFPKATALALGVASATGFAPLGVWPVLIVAFALLIHMVARAPTRRAATALGYWFGAGYFLLGLNWLAGTFRYQDTMPVWLGWFAAAGLALLLGVFPALSAAMAWQWGKPDRPDKSRFILFFAAAWIVSEYLRATVLTGFAWNPVGVSVVDIGAAAAAIGTYGLSGVVMLAAGGLVKLAQRKLLAAALFVGPLALSALGSFADVPGPTDGPAQPLIRIVQPNIGQQDKYLKDYAAQNFRKLEGLTGVAGVTPRLILWPEAAVPDYLGEEEWARARIAQLLGPRDVIITGSDDLIYDKQGKLAGAHNSAFIINADAKIIGRYDKAHLVPFGEYLALRWLLEPLGATRLVPGDIDFWEGAGPRTRALPGFGKVGIQICYEIIFSGEVVDRKDRPDFIFNPSNDAWFGSWQPPQHLAQARLRALEEGLPVVRSTPTGISAIIDARGRLVAALPYQKPGFLEARLPRPAEPTLFSHYGNILPLAFAVFLALLGIAIRPRVR